MATYVCDIAFVSLSDGNTLRASSGFAMAAEASYYLHVAETEWDCALSMADPACWAARSRLHRLYISVLRLAHERGRRTESGTILHAMPRDHARCNIYKMWAHACTLQAVLQADL